VWVNASSSQAGAGATGPPRSLPAPGLGFYAIVFTDIVESTHHRARFGDATADRLHLEVDNLTRIAVEEFRGSVVKGLGDGLLVIFRGPTEAVQASVALQHRLARRNRGADVALQVRVGVAVGEVDVTDDDVFGYTVNEAARLCAAAEDGTILVSEMAANFAGRANVEFGAARAVAITPSAPPANARPVLVVSEDLSLIPLPSSLEFSEHGGRFVGRTSELETLLTRWASASAGNVEVALLTGEPGLGKTTLLGELAREISQRPGIVLYGRCDERTAAPYQPFAEALGHFVEHCPAPELDNLLGPAANELSRLVPALGDRLASDATSRFSDPESERWRLQEAVGSALRSISLFEPLLLIVDDLHWAGTTTIDMLARILRDAAHQRLMVVLSLRPWDPATDPHVGQLLSDRHRLSHGVVDVALGGLEPGEVSELAAEWKHRGDIDAAETNELWEITAGNPLFVSQVLRTTGDDEIVPRQLPQGVVEVIDRQLDRLSEPARSLIRVAALVGQRFEPQVATLASETRREVSLELLDEAASAGVVRALEGTPLRYEFTHALVRRTIEDQFSPARRRDAHARIAAALEVAPTANRDDCVRRMAFHWCEAGEFGDPAKGVAASCAAAEIALSHLAIADASELLERAEALLALVPDDRLQCEVVVLRAEVRCLGAHTEARAAQLDAVAKATRIGDARLLARAALAHSRGYFSSYGRQDAERVAALRAALELCDDDRATKALLMSRLANELTFDDLEHRRFELVDEALELARGLDDPAVLARVLIHRQYVLGGPQFLETRLREVGEMTDIAAATGDRLLEMHSGRLLCAAATEDADVARLDRCLERLVQLNAEVDLAGPKWELASVRASRAIIAGRLREASSFVKEAFTLGAAAGQSDAFIFAGAQLMHLNYLRGRLPSIIDTFLDATPPEVTTPLVAWVARQLQLSGRSDEAARWWERSLSIGLDDQLEVGVNAGLVLTSWSYMAAVSEENRDVVEDLQRRMGPLAERLFNQLAPDQPGHHFLGLLADASGDYALADEHFASSLALLERIDAPVMAAITQVAWAGSLERRGDAERARALAAAARPVAAAAGATQIEQEATELLERVS
jgi:hypothetical protein